MHYANIQIIANAHNVVLSGWAKNKTKEKQWQKE
jgi:hypothetical protein